MKISTKKTYVFVFFLVVVLLYNSYKKSNSTVKEGYTGNYIDKNKQFQNINKKFENLKKVVAVLQAEVSLIKETINRKLKK